MKSALFGIVAYGFTSVLLFGGPLHAIALLMFWQERLGLAYWPALIPVAILLAIFATMFALRQGLPRVLLPAVFISISMGLAALLIGGYAEIQRGRIVKRFGPDVEIQSSIFASFRNAPREFQFFLHGAALKNCKPFAWSYRQITFYELPPNVAVNVLPATWIKDCKIQRTR
ncbi:hypothetical protein LZG00_16180 [Rhodobacteraceae bacterium LMO-12]|nr:hypothetical protein [Rhodobacteraceae bacterium LMO-JJ12]